MSGASTMRNAVKRITHKERAQPSDRKKFGLLEKHKDYIERAKDYKTKQNHITNLRRKALDRNPDEFYFKMNTSQVRNGVHHSQNEVTKSMDQAMVNLLKTQDMGYITTKKAIDDSKIKRLSENLHLIGDQRPKSHTVFVDSVNELDSFNPAEYFGTAPELVDRTFNRPKLANIDQTIVSSNSGAIKDGDSKKPAAYKELRERVKRSEKLKSAILQLTQQRNLSNSKGTKRKIVISTESGNSNKNGKRARSVPEKKEVVVYKWKKQRAH